MHFSFVLMIKLPNAGFMIDEYAPPDYTNLA